MPPGRTVSLGITSLPETARDRIEAALGRPVEWHDAPDLAPLLEDPASVTELLVSLPVELDRSTLERLPDLRYVGVLGTSFSNVDLETARAGGIAVTNVQHYCDQETAEFTTALVVGGLRGIFFETQHSISLAAARVGVVGLGQVGAIVADQLRYLGAEVIPFARGDGDRAARLARCHAVTVHGPRDVQVFGAPDLDALSANAGLVNTSNGTVLDESAFTRWLDRGEGWVALDAVAARTYGHLRSLAPDRVFVSARPAYRTPDATGRLVEQFVANLETHLRGR